MTREQAESLAKRLSVGPGGFEGWLITFTAKQYKGNTWEIEASGVWRDRDGKDEVVGWSIAPHPQLYSFYGEKVFLEFFSHEILKMVKHEWHEAFRVDGKPVIDPHPEERRAAGAAITVKEAHEIIKGFGANEMILDEVLK